MDHEKALVILSALADGVNPSTGEVFASDSPYQTADVVRALYTGIHALERPARKGQRRKGLPLNAGKPWTEAEDLKLLQLFDDGMQLETIAERFERTGPGIAARLERHGRLKVNGTQWRNGGGRSQ